MMLDGWNDSYLIYSKHQQVRKGSNKNKISEATMEFIKKVKTFVKVAELLKHA